jgi:hypothetical protein
MPQINEIRTNPNNPAQKARWDGSQWVDASAAQGPKPAPAWGRGAVELPDGSIGVPSGRSYKIVKKGAGSTSDAPMELTEDQGKAQGYARLMTDAERSYEAARRQGYDPGKLGNAFASFIEGAPLGILDGLAAIARDDVGDRGRQAEMQFSDAQLKAMSGAAAPEDEVKRNVKILFPRPGEKLSQIEPQKKSARTAAFESVRVRSGPAGAGIDVFPGAKGSSPDKPFDLSRGQSRRTIPRMAYYRDPEGNIRLNENSDDGNPIVIPAGGTRQPPPANPKAPVLGGRRPIDALARQPGRPSKTYNYDSAGNLTDGD